MSHAQRVTVATFVAATGLFVVMAWLVLRWTEVDFATHGRLTARSAVAAWLLYLFHADTVGIAAFTDIGRLPLPRGPVLVVGIAVASVGVVVFVAAAVALARRGEMEGFVSRRLVTDGAYAVIPHPQSLGWLLVLLGVAIAGRSMVALVLVGLFGAFAARYNALEDRDLRRSFGAGWERYRDTTQTVGERVRRRLA